MKMSPFLTGVLLACAALCAQPLDAVNSWIGNSGGKPANHVMHNVDNIFVRGDGTVYAITGWEEGGSNVSVFKDGAVIAVPRESGTGSWGRNSGLAVAADNEYIYQVLTQHGCDGGYIGVNDNGLPLYPPCETDNNVEWKCIARYTQDGNAAPFPQGYGVFGSYLLIGNDGKTPNGVAVSGEELFVADPTGDTIKVYSKANLTTKPVRAYHVPRAGLISLDSRGYLWMLQPADTLHAARIIRFSAFDGTLLPQQITFDSGVIPTAICLDNTQDRLLVTDNGINQNIRIYNSIFTTPEYTGNFGVPGGINSGVPGEIAPLKFINPMGVGVDTLGNIYVAGTGLQGGASRGTEMECYSADGTRQWVLYGLVFTGCADVDRSSETDVYTYDRHFSIDYSISSPGGEWSYKGYTINSFRYPDDPRVQGAFYTSALVRTFGGRRILYSSDMYGSLLSIHRFNQATDGETAIPCGHFTSATVGEGWPEGHATDKEWFWLDANGDGAFTADEYDNNSVDNHYSMAWWVDDSGGVWKGLRENGIRYFPFQGFNAYGAPAYSYASSIKYEVPEGTNGVKHICYDKSTDALYLGGFSDEVPDTGDSWYCLGSTICKYEGWLSGVRTPAWTLTLPFSVTGDGSSNAKAFCVEKDYLFVASVRQGVIYVYAVSDKSLVGTISPGPETDYKSGWTDIDIAITAMKRANGEYLVFMEENGFGKVMMYRWCPDGDCVETSVEARVRPGAIRMRQESSEVVVTNLAGKVVLRVADTRAKSVAACAEKLPAGIYLYQGRDGVYKGNSRLIVR